MDKDSFLKKNRVTLAIFIPSILLMLAVLIISVFVCTPEKLVGQDVEEQSFGQSSNQSSEVKK